MREKAVDPMSKKTTKHKHIACHKPQITDFQSFFS
ncbi:hypothetical protein YSA_02172 [Pseudomonas putida ND6]|uniref:Uncharacterized protein n=1 Tax=Pseudomonas putida ND6 TaxID=231023 RepID=I3UR23_PSEPU|nr:hypothetical protein YSA_02172 [Pseudomonas putida ND6]